MYSGVGFPLLSCNLNSFKYSLTCTWCLASHCSFFRSRHSSNRPRRRNHDSQICSGMPTTCSGQRPSQHHMGLGVWAHDLQKPSGGVRGLVIGDLLRPVVSRTIAQVFASDFQQACQPHQFALSTRAGTGAICAHQLIIDMSMIKVFEHCGHMQTLTDSLELVAPA